ACLSFLPNGARAYAVSGPDDPMLLPTDDGPSYLLINELSQHGRPHYISGPAARRAFARLRDGHRLVGTLHADSVDEAIQALVGEVGLTRDDFTRVSLVAITRVEDGLVTRGRLRPGHADSVDVPVRRRIVEIGLLAPDPDLGVRKVELAAWNTGSGRLETVERPAGVAALARWAGVPTPSTLEAIAERADVLARLAAEGRRDPWDVDDAVRRLRTR